MKLALKKNKSHLQSNRNMETFSGVTSLEYNPKARTGLQI